MTKSAKPTGRRVTALALMVLEEAASQARIEPIKRTIGHRLALAWLGYADVAEPWQVKQFWRALGKVEIPDNPSSQYCRDTAFDSLFRRWRGVAGLPGDYCRWRRELTRPDPSRSDFTMTQPPLAALNGKWSWRFLEDGNPPVPEHDLVFEDGAVTEAGLPCTVETIGDETRLRLSDNTAELRFLVTPGDNGEIAAQFWTLPAGVNDLGGGVAMELLEDAVLFRV